MRRRSPKGRPGIHVKWDRWVSGMYAEELHATTSSVSACLTSLAQRGADACAILCGMQQAPAVSYRAERRV
jgi:hypothetical protein